MFRSSSRFALLGVLLFAAILRGGVLWVMRGNLNEDRDAYREIAENLAAYRVYGLGKGSEVLRPTAYRPPLYPVMLAKLAGEGLAVTPLRVATLHWLLGMGTVWLTWIVAGMLIGNAGGGGKQTSHKPATEWRPTLAALLVACDPILLHWSTFVMTESLAAFLAILALYTLARFHFDRRPMNAGFAGCAMGLAILCRPTFLPWAALCGLGILFLQASGGRKPPDTSAPAKTNLIIQFVRRLANLALFAIVAAVVVFPWGYRNYQQFGKPIITTTHGGYTLYLANNDEYYTYLQIKSEIPWSAEKFNAQWGGQQILDRAGNERPFITKLLMSDFHLPAGEISEDALAYNRSLSCVQSNPIMFAYSCLYRIYQLWSPLPNKLTVDESWKRALLRYCICVWYLAVYAAALAGIWRLRGKLLRSPWFWGVLLCLVFTGVHTFYWSNLRMRAPLMPFVAMVAAAGATYLSVSRRARRT